MTDADRQPDDAARRARAAERVRRHRERRRRGVRPVVVEASTELIEALLAAGEISDDDLVDEAALSYALGIYLERAAGAE